MNDLEQTACPACKVEFATSDIPASSECPVCGYVMDDDKRRAREAAESSRKSVRQTKIDRAVKIFIGVMLFLFAVAAYQGQKMESESNARKAASEQAQVANLEPGQCITKSGNFYATSEAALDRAAHYANQKDSTAFAGMVMGGGLAELPGGQKVFYEGGVFVSRFRFPGSGTVYYAPREALICK